MPDNGLPNYVTSPSSGAVFQGQPSWRVSARRYAAATAICGVFSLVYEYFSHEVWSLWMIGLSLWPLLLGVVPALACGALRAHVCRVARDLWSCGVATLTVGSCLRGVLEIYGTTSMLVEPYMPVGLALLALGLAAGVLGSLREDRDRRKSIAASHRL